MSKKGFAVAVYATRLDPEQVLVSEHSGGRVGWKLETPGEEINLAPDVHISAYFVRADSADEARGIGLEWVLSDCPKADGWIAHHVNVVEVSRDELLDAVRATEAEEDDDADPVM